MSYFEYLEAAESYKHTWLRSHEESRCDCCSATISTGEYYHHFLYKLEGQIELERMCGQCWADMLEFAKCHEGTTVAPSLLLEVVDECKMKSVGVREGLKWARMAKRIRTRGALGNLKGAK